MPQRPGTAAPAAAARSQSVARLDKPPALPLQLRAGNVLGEALQGEAPFDAIHVGAGGACRLQNLHAASKLLSCWQPAVQGGPRSTVLAATCLPSSALPAAASALPDVLVRCLKPGGRMVIPVGSQWEHQARPAAAPAACRAGGCCLRRCSAGAWRPPPLLLPPPLCRSCSASTRMPRGRCTSTSSCERCCLLLTALVPAACRTQACAAAQPAPCVPVPPAGASATCRSRPLAGQTGKSDAAACATFCCCNKPTQPAAPRCPSASPLTACSASQPCFTPLFWGAGAMKC